MQQEVILATSNRRLSQYFIEGSRKNKQIQLKTIDTPAKLNKIFNRRGNILEVLVLDMTLPDEELNRFIFYIKKYKEDLPVVLLSIDCSIPKKEGEAIRNLAVYRCIKKPSSKDEAQDILNDFSKIFDLDMDKKLYKVEYLQEENVFSCTFKNLKTYFLKKSDIPEDDGSKVINAEISEDEYYFTVYYESGREQTVPWDFILHMCEENYEFYKTKSAEKITAEEIGERISSERKIRRLTQEDLADKTRILRANIARIESGKHYPSLETLEKIAKALEVPVAKFLVKKVAVV